VNLPRSLQQIADTKIHPSVESEQQPAAPSHVPAGAGSAEFTVDKAPASNKILVHSTSHAVEPLHPAALPVPVPPVVVGSPVKQEQSRISIGSLEVLVNNHPPVAPASPPTSISLLNEKANLERRYLDRFRLRH